jgi:hypothetical protein
MFKKHLLKFWVENKKFSDFAGKLRIFCLKIATFGPKLDHVAQNVDNLQIRVGLAFRLNEANPLFKIVMKE